jgi:hypothetical protein
LPATEGGLGLVKLTDYITAIQCSWVKRTTQHWGDNWRYDLKIKCFGNPLIADRGTFTFRENPILSNITTSFGKFKQDFTSMENNYKKALILNNPFFRRGRNDNGILCERFFGNNYEELRKISKLKFEDFFVRRNVPKSLDELNREFSTNFTLVTYMRLHEALEFAANKKANEDGKSQSMGFFLKSFDRGSRQYRKILQLTEISRWKIENLNTLKTFIELCGLDKPSKKSIQLNWGEWNRNYFQNRCREFLYKFRNNILGLNLRVSKFVQGVDAECSLCSVSSNQRPIPAESFVHVFFDCPVSDKYRTVIEQRLFPEMRNTTENERKKFWFLGILPGMPDSNLFVNAVISLSNFLIWECKLRKEIIPAGTLVENLLASVKKCLYISSALRTVKNKTNLFVCRHISDPP